MFQFLRNYFTTAERERVAERDHQLALVRELVRGIEAFSEGQARVAEENTKGLLRVAEALAAQAAALGEWFKSFQSATPVAAPNAVADPDEVASDLKDLYAAAGKDIPPEFALALELHQQDFYNEVRRDNRA